MPLRRTRAAPAATFCGMTIQLNPTFRSLTVLLVLAATCTASLSACGGDKQVSSSDRTAFDDFAQGARSWQRSGAGPWMAAFKGGAGELSAAAPGAQASMQRSIDTMSSASKRISVPAVRKTMAAMVATYRAKLATLKQISAGTGSMAQIRTGLTDLATEGKTTLAAWKAYVRAAKAEWSANPLSGLKIG